MPVFAQFAAIEDFYFEEAVVSVKNRLTHQFRLYSAEEDILLDFATEIADDINDNYDETNASIEQTSNYWVDFTQEMPDWKELTKTWDKERLNAKLGKYMIMLNLTPKLPLGL